MTPLNVAFILAGIVLLYLGGEALVKHACRLGKALGVTPLVIGLTIVAFGTSAPELAASMVAAFKGAPDVIIGNVLGSNVANIGLILGLSALVRPLPAEARFLRREVPFMIGVTALLYPLLHDGALGRLEGALLLLLLGGYLWVLFTDEEAPDIEEEMAEALGDDVTVAIGPTVLMLVLAITALTGGAHLLVEGAIAIARAAGVEERVIGLTLVAFGTSLPELASCLVAAYRRQADVALGNVVGSNVFNVLAVLGCTVEVRPFTVALDGLWVDLAVTLLLSILLYPFAARHLSLGRTDGAALLGVYGLYIGYLLAFR